MVRVMRRWKGSTSSDASAQPRRGLRRLLLRGSPHAASSTTAQSGHSNRGTTPPWLALNAGGEGDALERSLAGVLHPAERASRGTGVPPTERGGSGFSGGEWGAYGVGPRDETATSRSSFGTSDIDLDRELQALLGGSGSSSADTDAPVSHSSASADETALRAAASAVEGGTSVADGLAGHHDDAEDLPSLLRRQYELETSALEHSVSKYRDTYSQLLKMGRGAELGPAKRLVAQWFVPLVEAIDREQQAVWRGDPGKDRKRYGPYLILLPPESLSVITVHTALNQCLQSGGRARFASVATAIGRHVQAEVALMKLKRKDRNAWRNLNDVLRTGSSNKPSVVTRHARAALETEDDWPTAANIKLGSILLDLLFQTARVQLDPVSAAHAHAGEAGAAGGTKSHGGEDTQSLRTVEVADWYNTRAQADATRLALDGEFEGADSESESSEDDVGDLGGEKFPNKFWRVQHERAVQHLSAGNDETELVEPAFAHQYAYSSKKMIGTVVVNPVVMDMFDQAILECNHPMYYPMLVPPKPWSAPRKGGYLRQRTEVMRMRGSKSQSEAMEVADLSQVYRGLDVLGAVPWRINSFVHDVVKSAWDGGGGVGDLPPRENPSPPPPPAFDEMGDIDARELAVERRRYAMRLKRAMQHNQDLHSLRCDMALKLQVAKDFSGEQFYFPFNLDFRGRAYPVPPHLNHLGSDVCRGLLTFADARPLGERGLRWLKIHLSNLMGFDKASLDEREAYADEHLSDILDSAANPLGGERWWLTADNPWQALAACKELADAFASGDATSFLSTLPVHQDGSCNGLQHYAALGRDAEGGAAVNLAPSSRPQDVYSEVLGHVHTRIASDAKASAPPAELLAGKSAADQKAAIEKWKRDRECAQFVAGSVTRKVVKQTVMTSVYGVTFIGARRQIQNRLEEVFADHPMPVEELDRMLYDSAGYLARITLDSLKDMFNAAESIKEWLTECARLVAVQNQPMVWTTPMGLPVVQPYRRPSSVIVKTVSQNVTVVDQREQLPVSVARQCSAFPPNYVHSLDSTHMLLTAIECAEMGLTFTAVHDSYWTHAGTVDAMNGSLRRQFIELYQQPLLERFAESLHLRYPHTKFPGVPERGDLDLRQVLEAQYFFS